jgi:hypothetical protein
MNWYFNNEGRAEGPYDEGDMRAQVKKGAVTAHTLVWQATMEAWEEAAPLNAPWWQAVPAKPAVIPIKPPSGPLTDGLRRPVPNAPITAAKGSRIGELFKRLFGRGGKKQ